MLDSNTFQTVFGKDKDSGDQRQALKADLVMNRARAGFIIMDEEGTILEANRAACRMLDYSADELVRLKLPDLERPGESGPRLLDRVCDTHPRARPRPGLHPRSDRLRGPRDRRLCAALRLRAVAK